MYGGGGGGGTKFGGGGGPMMSAEPNAFNARAPVFNPPGAAGLGPPRGTYG